MGGDEWMIEAKRWGKAVFYGVFTILIIALISSFLLSILLRFTSLTEDSLFWVITSISFLAVFIGGFIAGGKGKEKGWLLGGATAVAYTGIVLLFQFLGYGKTLSLESLLYHGGFLITSIVGGMLGVNISSPKRQA
jgi:putative membrane protein (TIGR04086 family)